MKKLLLCLFFVIICTNVSFSQNVFFDWVKSAGSSNDDIAYSNAVDKKGNSYITGTFTGKVDFNPGKDTAFLSSNGENDIFILKLDKNGDFVWANSIGGKSADQGNSITLDTFGNIFISGSFSSRVDFDPDTSSKFLQSSGGKDAFIAKYNSSGDLFWANSLGGFYDESAYGITVGMNGVIYFTGSFQDTVKFSTGTSGKSLLISRGKNDILVARCDTGGNYLWIRSMGGTGDDIGYSVVSDKNENVITTGFFSDKCNFSTNSISYILTSFGSTDAFISKIDGKGNFTFAFQLGGTSEEVGKSVKLDAGENIISTGWFNGTADFNPSKGTTYLYSNGKSDIYISKLTSSGGYTWVKQFGGTNDDKGYCLNIDANSNIYSTGYYQSKVDFDPSTSTYNLTAKGKEDVFISKIYSNGSFHWAKSLGGRNTDIGNCVFVGIDNKVFTTGNFTDTTDFNPDKDSFNIISNGVNDAFIHKMAICTTSHSSQSASNCYSITINGETYTSSGTYYQTLTAKRGCDSILTLYITIFSTTIGNLDVVACKSYTLNGTTYTQPGTYYQTIKNAQGCDSIIVLTLQFGESSSSLTAIACDKYTLNAISYTSSGTFNQVIKNHYGCDSTITLKLTIKKSTSSNVKVTACNSFNIKTTTYTQSGIYTQTIKNYNDCDSVITLELTINKSTDTTILAEACSSYKLNATTYNQSGSYKQILKNHLNCDSVINLVLKLNNSSSEINVTACKSFSIGSNTFNQSGTYNVIIPNHRGCDSAVLLNLTIKNIDNTIKADGRVLSANQVDAQYQWLDCNSGLTPIIGQIYKEILVKNSGKYAVKISKDVCVDTSECVLVELDAVENVNNDIIKISPNPVSDFLNIEIIGDLEHGTFKIYNSVSQVVLEKQNFESRSFNLDLSRFHKGIYIVEINSNSGVIISRFIKI